MERIVKEDTPRVLALAAAFFGGLAVLGWIEGVFARMSPGTLQGLGLLVSAVVAATLLLDREVRALLAALPRLRKGAAKSPGARPAAT